jgi:methylmalonyl-CoA/ethylmalonyl-CoA epimerase
MSTVSRIADLGEVMQIAFVPPDFDATLNFWVNTMGAGPFFVLKGTKAEWFQYCGKDSDPELDLALGHWGDMQIEIIRQTNSAPSPFTEWRGAGGEGVHHVCVVVDDIEKAKRVAREKGGTLMANGRALGTEWIYIDTGGGPGTVLEVVCYAEASKGLMKMIRDAARGWDGKDPIREIVL